MKKKSLIKKLFILFLIILAAITSTSAASPAIDKNKPCVVIHAGEYPR